MKKLFTTLALATIIASCSDDNAVIPDLDESSTPLIELDGFGTEVTNAIATIYNEDTIIKRSLVLPDTSLYLTASLDSIPMGEYSLLISIFEGENIAEDNETRGWYRGQESYSTLTISESPQSLLVRGPEGIDSDYQLEPSWSQRLFQSYIHEKVPAITISFPVSPCEFDIRILPDYMDRQPDYSYIDYFAYNTGQTEPIGIDECFGTCDIREQINAFASTINLDKQELCSETEWELMDTIIMLSFGDDVDEFVIFYQRWINGEVVVL